jgi:hypothetical protein
VEEETYWFIEIPVWDHDQSTDRVKRSFEAKEDAESFYERAFNIFDKDKKDWQNKTNAKTNNYGFTQAYFGVSGFMNGEPRMFECRRIK